MNIINVEKVKGIEGPLVITIEKHYDRRGFFVETFRNDDFKQNIGLDINFVQDCFSHSCRCVFRGLHWQIINPMDKLVFCISGSIYDVFVDIRKDSKTFGCWGGELISDNKMILIPKGFAHGFFAIGEKNDVLYKCSNIYSLEGSREMKFFNAMKETFFEITGFKTKMLLLSDKDMFAKTFNEMKDGSDFFEGEQNAKC